MDDAAGDRPRNKVIRISSGYGQTDTRVMMDGSIIFSFQVITDEHDAHQKAYRVASLFVILQVQGDVRLW